MSENVVPSLDSSGWQTGVAQKAEKLFAYWLTSERSQSNIHGNIESLPSIIQRYKNDNVELEQDVKRSLSDLFVDYFESVSVEVRVEPIDGPNSPSARMNIKISLLVRQNGLKYSLNRLLTASNKTITKIKDLNRE